MTQPGAHVTAPRAPLWVYVGTVTVGAGALFAVAYAVGGAPRSWWALTLLSSLAALGWVLRERDVGAGVQFSVTSIVLLAAAALLTPLGAGIVGMVATLPQGRSQRFLPRLFNVALGATLGVLGGLTYRIAGGVIDLTSLESPSDIIIRVGLPLVVADVVHALVNALLIAGVVHASRTGAFRPQLLRMLTTTGPAYVSYGIIGFLLVVLWVPAGVGWFSAVLILAPLFVARWAFAQYGEEQRAHESTLRALVSATGLKDAGASGHSSRVATLCEWTAEVLGLGPRDIEDVRTAGMLHDLGLIAVPAHVLHGPEPEEWSDVHEVARHTRAGVEMLAGISFLRGALPMVHHHHERVDGRGYPDGLSGADIPLGARVVAAADVFDALTSPRTSAEALDTQEALTMLHLRVGSQLDGRVVDALARGVRRHGWYAVERADMDLPHPPAGWSHDDPHSSDLAAGTKPWMERAL